MTFRTDTHGRYDIRSGPLAGAWAANGYRRKALVTKASSHSLEDAVNRVKAQLNELDGALAAGRDKEDALPATVYEEVHYLRRASGLKHTVLRRSRGTARRGSRS